MTKKLAILTVTEDLNNLFTERTDKKAFQEAYTYTPAAPKSKATNL
ncbi:hypothetical protein MTP04_26220 [Lysinibacillus sp. PLM2]|nr:hypothetical protein MTP04_26220 [Lysinibacillus sp. PLM2]